jgi:hypothetical protein
MRRVLEHAGATQVGIRSLCSEEASAIPALPTRLFYDFNMRRDAQWIERVVDSLGETVYITIDCDGLDPAIMPAPARQARRLTWTRIALLRRVIDRIGRRLRHRRALSLPGNVARTSSQADLQDLVSLRGEVGRELKLDHRTHGDPAGAVSATSLPKVVELLLRVGGEESGNSSTTLKVCCASAGLPASAYVRPSCIRMPSTGNGPSFCCASSLNALMA